MTQSKKKATDGDPIVQNLRRVYDDIANETVPDRLLDLLEQLKKQDGEKSGDGASE